MAGKTVKKSGAAATARTPIVRKAVKGTPGYMQPTLASKAKAMRRPLVQEENPGWFDVMHRVAAWVTSLEPYCEGTEEDFMSRASSINVPYGDHEKLHSDSSRVHPPASSITSTTSSHAIPSGGRSHVPRKTYGSLQRSSRVPPPASSTTSSTSSIAVPSGGRSNIPRGSYQRLHCRSHIPPPSTSSTFSHAIPSRWRSHIPRRTYPKPHGSFQIIPPASTTSTASSIAVPSGGRSHIPRGNYKQLHGCT
ncbi:hypothetical protein BDZ91DRAFT_801126 [Kalaharituber pfeilii]|nr:hypothetical protein BDZ91DRAFT_801126 [Kalaharituber pfeilii]